MLTHITTQNLISVIFIVHITILLLIFGCIYANGINSLQKPITRGQILIIIISIWFLLCCFNRKQSEQESTKFDSYNSY